MSLLQNFTHRLLRTNPTVQVVDGEPQDVEKDTQQTTETAYNNFIHSPSLRFKASRHGFKHAIFKGLPTLNSYQSPTYRGLPIISGILIPFSILLSIPSLTDRWHIRTDSNDVILETRQNPLLLNLGMGFSMACGVLANICLVVRFAERNVLRMTWLCILFLTLHDLINISAVTSFGVQHRFHDGFTYGQSFWFTVCSTVASTATNITLIIDYSQTKDFVNSGSGLTHKQRSLVIIIIILLSYLALGSLIQTFMLKIPFIDALYFNVVSIETIGFGDLHPISTDTRIFTSFYIAGGMLNLALAAALLREVLLEGVALRFQTRVKVIRTRQRERRIRTRWRTAVKSRLRANNLPMWVVDSSGENEQDWQYHHHHHWWRWARQGWDFLRKRLSRKPADKRHRKRKHLNLEALTEAQMENAALEAGAPLADLLPPRLQLASVAVIGDDMEGDDDDEVITERGGIPFIHSMTMQDEVSLEDTLLAEEKIIFAARLTLAFLVFIVFWMAGSAIFMKTEKWDFGTAAYFCFIAFTTVGYGDFSPQTPAGRSIFVAWALLGVATMTILISLLVEAYSSQFKSAIRTNIFPDDINTADDGSGTRHIQIFESPGTINVGMKEQFVSPVSLLATSSSIGNPSKTGHRDQEQSLASVLKDGSQNYNKESLESLHEILRRAQTLRSLIAPDKCHEDPELTTPDLRAPQVTDTPLSDTWGPRSKAHQIERTMQDIITAAHYALEVLDSEDAVNTRLEINDSI